jgi:hypothetical protein
MLVSIKGKHAPPAVGGGRAPGAAATGIDDWATLPRAMTRSQGSIVDEVTEGQGTLVQQASWLT